MTIYFFLSYNLWPKSWPSFWGIARLTWLFCSTGEQKIEVSASSCFSCALYRYIYIYTYRIYIFVHIYMYVWPRNIMRVKPKQAKQQNIVSILHFSRQTSFSVTPHPPPVGGVISFFHTTNQPPPDPHPHLNHSAVGFSWTSLSSLDIRFGSMWKVFGI